MNEVLKQALQRGPGCPPLTELLESADRFREHIHGCPACQTEVAAFQRFSDEPQTASERAAVRAIVASQTLPGRVPAAKPSAWSRFLSPAWMGGAAMALAAIVFAVGIGSQWTARHTGTDAGLETGQMRSQSVNITSPHGDLETMSREIRWQPVVGAAAYAVTVSEVDRTVLIYENVTSPAFVLPDPTYTLVMSGKTILVNVTALDAAGKQTAASGFITFHVIPQSH